MALVVLQYFTCKMKNAFFDKGKTTQLLQSAKYLVGGILKNIRSVTAILKPTINGYKRLVHSHEVPAYIALALSNRSGLIRDQCKRGNSIRVELRSWLQAVTHILHLRYFFSLY